MDGSAASLEQQSVPVQAKSESTESPRRSNDCLHAGASGSKAGVVTVSLAIPGAGTFEDRLPG
jgi:hypothetical protein